MATVTNHALRAAGLPILDNPRTSSRSWSAARTAARQQAISC